MSKNLWDSIKIPHELIFGDAEVNYDVSFEAQILTLFVKNSSMWSDIGHVMHPNIFRQPVHREFIKMLCAFDALGGRPPDHTSLIDFCSHCYVLSDGCGVTREELIDQVHTSISSTVVTSRDYVESRLKVILRQAGLRAVSLQVLFNERAAKAGKQVDEAFLDEQVASVHEALAIAKFERADIMSIKDDFADVSKWFDERKDQTIPTLISSLDDMLYGGLRRKELGVIVAPPNAGKTFTLINLAAGAHLAGHNVLYISNEDGVRGIGPRLASRYTGLTEKLFVENMGHSINMLHAAVHLTHGDLRIIYMPPRRTRIVDISAMLTRMEATGFQAAMVVVDYADRLAPPLKRRDKWDELVDIYMDLRALAERHNVALWTASQTSKEGFRQKTSDLDNMAGAFQKAGEADVVLTYNQTKEEMAANQARLYLAKARNRPKGGTVWLHADRERCRLTAVAPHELDDMILSPKVAYEGVADSDDTADTDTTASPTGDSTARA